MPKLMKYWAQKTDIFHGISLAMIGHRSSEQIFAIWNCEDGTFQLTEDGADDFECIVLPKQQAIAALQEAIDWIKGQP